MRGKGMRGEDVFVYGDRALRQLTGDLAYYSYHKDSLSLSLSLSLSGPGNIRKSSA